MKKALSAVLAVVLVLGVCFSVPMIASANNTDPFTYELDNAENPTGYIITGVKKGVEGEVQIPATYKPEGDIELFYPKNSEEPNVGSYEVTTTVAPSEEAGTATVAADEEVATDAVVTIKPATGYTLKSITVGGTPVAELPTDVEGVYTYKFTPNADVEVAVVFEKVNYTIEVSDAIENGSVAVVGNKTTATMGDEIELTNTPKEGYDFVAYSVNEGAVTVTDGKFTMPAGNVTISATFEKEPEKYAVTVAEGIQNGTVTVDPTSAIAGADVVVTAIPATVEGKKYVVKTVSYTYGEGESAKTETVVANQGVYSFKMPAAAVKVTATFVEVFAITDVNTATGKVTASVAEAEAGATVTLTVDPEDGYQLVANSLKVNNGDVTVTDNTFTMPAAAVTVTAEFEAIEYKAEVATGIINGKVEATAKRGETAITDLEKLNIGDTVTLTLTIDKGCELKADTLQVSYTDGEGTKTVALTTVEANKKYTFSMPAANVTISAQIIPSELDVVGIAADAFQGENAKKITSFTVADGQDLFVAEDGVLFEKVAGTAGAADTLKLIAFPAAYEVEVEEGEVATYTIPATVNGLAVTAVADGAFQALGNVKYIFCADEDITSFDKHPAFYTTEGEGEEATKVNNKKLHLGMTDHIAGELKVKEGEAATCQTEGTKIKECTYCGAVVHTEKYTDANAHNFLEANEGWVVVIPATCKQQGSSEKKCQNTGCDYVERRYDAVTGHTFPSVDADNDGKLDDSNYTIDKYPTCEDGKEETVNTGLKSRHCTVCDAKEEPQIEIPALTHTITDNGTNENITAKTEATCTEDGSITGNCDHCGKEVTLTLTKTGHKYIEVVDAEATCTVNGWQHEECEYCGDYLDGSDMELKAPGHVAATVKNGDKVELKWTVVKAPTCSEDGFAEVRCANCGIQMVDPEGKIEYTRVLPATGKHDFGETWTVTKAATCEEEGEETGTCACGYTKTRKIKALGHKWAEEHTVDNPATCTKKGSESIKCTVCGEKDEDSVRETALAPHTADDTWKTVEGKAATCYAEGEKTGTCTVCKTENCVLPIEKLEHKWAETAVNLKAPLEIEVEKVDEDGNVVLDADKKPVMVKVTVSAPTCEDEGYQAIYCTNKDCPTSIIKEGSLVKVDALGHKFDDTYNTGIPDGKEATCKEAGYTFKWCDTCSKYNTTNDYKGYVRIELDKKEHTWNDKAENLRADITIKVPELDEKGNVVLGKDGNPVMVDKVVSAPDCENKGYTAVYCKNFAVCGEYKDVTEVEALGHLYDETKWTKVSDATCMAKEIQSNTCLRADCEHKNQTREYGDFADHKFATTYTYEYQTCEKDGRKYYACTTKLGDKQCEAVSGVEVLPALGHKHATDAKWVGSDATCTEDGEKVKECLNLFNKVTGEPYKAPANNTPATQAEGDTTTGTEGSTTTTPATRPAAPEGYEYCEGAKQVTKATGHKFADTYTEDKEPTCLEAGKESRHCTNKDCTEKTGSRDIPALGHNYSTEYKTVTPATCQAEGKEARYCTNEDCEEYSYERKLAKTSHIYLDTTWDTIKAPTCDEKGVQENFCSVCNKANDKTAEGYTTRETNARGHIWALDYVTEKATCTTAGATYIPCERAGCDGRSNETILPATGHDWATEEDTIETAKPDDAAEKEKAVTCTEDGYEYKYCKTCKVWIGEVIKAEGHKYDGEPKRVDPTCYSTGSLTGKCVNTYCDAEDKNAAVQTLPKLNHTWGDWELAPVAEGVKADCTAKDSMIRKCTVKGCNGSETGENKAHTESGWILDADATCSTKGKMHTECTVCKFEMNKQTLYATDAHEYEEDTTKRVEPTCIEPGSKTLVCKNCEGKKVEEIAPTDHTFTEWKVFVEPTCTEKGIRQSVCTVCLTTKSEKILALGHDLSKDVITAPTCTVAGSKHQECSRCDYKTEATPIAALGHNYTTSNTCSAKDCGAQLYEYKLIGESKTDIEITKYNGSDKNVVIPSEIDGYIVKAIGDRAFMKIVDVPGAVIDEETGERAQTTTRCEKSTIETVTIPETVTTIGAYAFASASDNFKSVVIPGTVTTIGDYAFGYNATITWEKAEAKEGEKVEDLPLVEKISATTVNTEDFTFAIYGVKDSAAAVYAAQDPKVDTDDFKFAAIADIYEVAIPKGAEAEKSGDNVVLFKEFAVKNADGTKAPEIDEQIAAVIDINVSGYSVEVVSSQSYEPVDKDGNVIEKDCKYFYGTGTKVLVKEGNNVVDVIEIAVQGDVNGDGISDAIDCMLIQLAAQKQKTLDGVYYTAGNITSDTAIDANDFSAAVLKIFGEDHIVGGKEEATTVTTTAAPTTQPTTETTTEATTVAPESTEATTAAPAESTEATTEATTVAPTTEATTEATTVAPTTTENSAA